MLDVWVVREYTYVFPEELPGLPPDHEIEFSFELALTRSIPCVLAKEMV